MGGIRAGLEMRQHQRVAAVAGHFECVEEREELVVVACVSHGGGTLVGLLCSTPGVQCCGRGGGDGGAP